MKTKLLLLVLFGFLLSCHKDIDQISEDEIIDPPVILVTTKFVSQTDTIIESARHATQTFAGASMPYTSFPFLVTRGNKIDRDFELITLTTQDLHQFFQVQSFIENDVNYLHWVLPDLHSFQANASENAHLSINGNFELSIPAASLLHIDGTPYSGNYIIEYALLDPFTFLADAIPSFVALDDHHQSLALQIKACFYISAFSESGEKLQFTSTASIGLLGTVTGDHWYFDTAQAAWKSNNSPMNGTRLDLGSATYYSIGVSDKPVRIKGNLHINGRLTPHQRMMITYGGVTRTIYTTNLGAWATYLPSGQEITINVPLPCGNTFSTIFISPDEDEFELPIGILDEGSINSVFQGTLRNNQGGELQEAILVLDGASPGFLYSGEAAFSFNVPICNSYSLGVQGLDIATGQSGSVIHWKAADSVQVYSVFACEESRMEYLSLNISGDNKMYWDLKSSVNPQSRILIEEGLAEANLDLAIFISGMMAREYSDEELNIRFEDQQLGQRGYSLYCPTSTSGCGFSKFIITHYPEAQGQWIRGYFEGNFWIKTFHPLTAGYKPVRGEFQVYRDF